MDELISRQAAIDALAKFVPYAICDESTESYTNGLTDAYNLILQLPSAQPRGKWIYHPEIGWGETWLCDQCGEKTTSTVMGKPRDNFCPNCGADMRQREE